MTKAAAAEFAFLLRPAAPPCGYGLPYPASRDKQIPMGHGQLTADEMGILPSTYGVPFTG